LARHFRATAKPPALLF